MPQPPSTAQQQQYGLVVDPALEEISIKHHQSSRSSSDEDDNGGSGGDGAVGLGIGLGLDLDFSELAGATPYDSGDADVEALFGDQAPLLLEASLGHDEDEDDGAVKGGIGAQQESWETRSIGDLDGDGDDLLETQSHPFEEAVFT